MNVSIRTNLIVTDQNYAKLTLIMATSVCVAKDFPAPYGKTQKPHLCNMKRAALFIIAFLGTLGCLYSQNYQTKQVIINNNKYTIEKTSRHTVIKPYFKDEALSDKVVSAEYLDFQTSENYNIMDAFKSAFSKRRLKQMLPERSLIISLTINTADGKVVSTWYVLRKNSVITLKEIDKLNTALTRHLTFIFNKAQVKDYPLVGFSYNIPFQMILDETLVLHP